MTNHRSLIFQLFTFFSENDVQEDAPSCDTKAKFAKETIDQLSKTQFKNEKTKFAGDALIMTTEMMRIYVIEAAHRAAYQTKSEGSQTVQLEHIEKILPQFLLDFS